MTFATLLSYGWVAIVFLAMISILVAAHEYGHYFFARLFGMGVEEFAIGMGKKLKVWGRKTYDVPVPDHYIHTPGAVSKGERLEGGNVQRDSEVVDTPNGRVLKESTEFTVRMLPIGGFVRIKGMIPEEDGSEVNIPGGFYSKPPWQRLIVLFAGPVASVVSGVIALILLFMIHGVNRPINEPVIGSMYTDGPAGKANLAPGDRIVSINGSPINTFYDLVEKIYPSAGKKLEVEYERKGQRMTTVVTPKSEEGMMLDRNLDIRPGGPQMRGAVLIGPQTEIVKLGLIEAMAEAFRIPVEAVRGVMRIVTSPSKLKDEAGGAVTMVAATYEATQNGAASVIALACLLSISVGIFNLLPFPPLDGGQMIIAFAELLRRGRRLSIQVQQAVMSAGFAVVILLAVVVLFIDIQRFAKPDPRGGRDAQKIKTMQEDQAGSPTR